MVTILNILDEFIGSQETVDGAPVLGYKGRLCYDILIVNVHPHPGTGKYSMRFSDADMSLSVSRNIPVFIGNMNGDTGVFMPGMSTSGGYGPILCTGCEKQK